MKHILFDLDGTLTDSGEGIINCAQYTLRQLGLPVPEKEQLRFFVGPPLRESLTRLGVPPEALERAVEIYRSRYMPIGIWENTPYPGIQAMLEKLKQAGHRLYIATGKPENMASIVLEHFSLDGYFDMVCGASMDHQRDTKAKVIAHLLSRLNSPENVVMVGDTVYDVIGAKENGIPTIGVAWGYGETKEMAQAGACAIVRSPEALVEILL